MLTLSGYVIFVHHLNFLRLPTYLHLTQHNTITSDSLRPAGDPALHPPFTVLSVDNRASHRHPGFLSLHRRCIARAIRINNIAVTIGPRHKTEDGGHSHDKTR